MEFKKYLFMDYDIFMQLFFLGSFSTNFRDLILYFSFSISYSSANCLVIFNKENWYLEILLALFCGLRKGEIMVLKFSDFNVEKQAVKKQIFLEFHF